MLKKAFKAAWPKTIPIMAGFLFLGFSYGVYMNVSGISFVYPHGYERGDIRQLA